MITPCSNDKNAQPEAILASFLEQPLPAYLIHILLRRIATPCPLGELQQACTLADQNHHQSSPSQRLSAAFNQLKLKGVQPAQLRWRRFDQRKLPVLIFHQAQWYIAEHGDSRGILLTNSDGDTRLVSAGDLQDSTVLYIRTKAKPASRADQSKNPAAKLVLRELFKNRRWLRDVLIATLIINTLAVATSMFAMQVYDRVVPTLAYATMWTLVVGMAVIIGLDWLLKTLRARILDSVSCEVSNNVSQQVFDHVMHLRLDLRPRSLGTLAAQIGGLDIVRQFFSSGVVFLLIDAPFALFFIAFIWMIGGPIALVYAALLPLALAVGFICQARMRRLTRNQMMRSNERQGLLVDAIHGTESIRTNNATWRFSQLWGEITHSIGRYNIQQKAISSFSNVTTGMFSSAAYVAAVVVGVHQIEAGAITMGAMIACSIVGGRVIGPISQSVQHLMQWQDVTQSLQMVNQVLVLETQRDSEQNLLLPDTVPQDFTLEKVTFSHPQSAVQQLNIQKLELHAGDRVLLLGPVGCGKSTLLKVLAGLYRPSEGRIRLGGADLWQMDPNSVNDLVGYLPQSVHLFKGTLHSNLALSGAVGDSQLLKISAELGIDKIAADSPLGINLEIGEGGDGLSGGQRQLVGLGRVFLAQPRIWLLDEPSASLDSNSDALLMEAIKNYVRPTDILVIATHRLALISSLANRVLVMREGEIIEDGKPQQVLPKLMNRSKPPAMQPANSDRTSTSDSLKQGEQNAV